MIQAYALSETPDRHSAAWLGEGTPPSSPQCGELDVAEDRGIVDVAEDIDLDIVMDSFHFSLLLGDVLGLITIKGHR